MSVRSAGMAPSVLVWTCDGCGVETWTDWSKQLAWWERRSDGSCWCPDCQRYAEAVTP